MLYVRTDKDIRTAAWYGSKHGHCGVASKHCSDLSERRTMSNLTFENLAECHVDKAARRQGLEQAVCQVNAGTRLNRLKDARRQKQSDGIHQSIGNGGYDDRLVAVVNTD